MACNITVADNSLVNWPFAPQQPNRPGGRAFGSVRFTATCDDERSAAEVQLNEDISSVWTYLSGSTVYSRHPPVKSATGGVTGFVVIEDARQEGPNSVLVQLNLTTRADGAQTFDIKLKCRCNPTSAWSEMAVSVPISI